MKILRKTTVLLMCFAIAALFCGCSLFAKPSPDLKPHLIAESDAESEPVRPIDSCETLEFKTTAKESQLDELLNIVYKPQTGVGHKPDFSQTADEVKEVYDAAVSILDRYIRNDYSEFERVHAIHDYLAYYTEYDYELASLSRPDSSDPAFGLVGALINHKAVCDGFSKAFLLLCGIEQISCIRITGGYNADGVNINHAWNKVCVGGVWYNVDATMDSWHVITDGKTTTDLLGHGYFMLSDADMKATLTGRHTEDDNLLNNRECNKTYDFYGTTALGIGDYAMEITSQEQLNDVFARIKKSKRKIGKVELKLNFPEYAASNLEREDAYVRQISEAYGKVSDRDFVFEPSNGAYPYQRYPNGVYIFLIYK